jgi:hypothetical protein
MLESFFPVILRNDADARAVSGAVLRIGNAYFQRSAPSISFLEGANVFESEVKKANVRFANHAEVPFPFKGRSLDVNIPVGFKPLVPTDGERVLLDSETGPIWVVRCHDSVPHFRVALPLPVFSKKTSFIDFFNGERFLETLLLVTFLRRVTGEWRYYPPKARACFMFDDPNLHWRTYGFVNFCEIAKRAEKLRYHVSFATIPLDAWFAHKSTVSLFKESSSRLSLLVHGNNHVKMELGRSYSPRGRSTLAKQALSRIQRFEQKYGVQVARVMVPPHGACSSEMLAALANSGFEAACISHGSLRAHNAGQAWTSQIGYLPAEWINGCPVIPRNGFSGKNVPLLAAFCNQPVILRAHHQELRAGIELLDQSAAEVNRLGEVSWMDMGEIARRNYQYWLDGPTLRLRLYSRRVALAIPEGVSKIVVENSFDHRVFVASSDPEDFSLVSDGSGEIVLPRTKLAIRSVVISLKHVDAKVVPNSMALPAIWPVVRRIMTEVRDRSLPFT